MLVEELVKEFKEDLNMIFDKEPKVKTTEDYVSLKIADEKFCLYIYRYPDEQFSVSLEYKNSKTVLSDVDLSEIRDLILKKVCNL